MIKINQLKPIFPSVYHENLRSMLAHSVSKWGEKDAFIIKHKIPSSKEVSYEHVTYLDFQNRINALGTAMFRRGWQDKRVAIIGQNCCQWLESYFAVLGGLGIVIPLDKGLPYEELESSLIRSYADILIFDAAHKDMAMYLMENNTSQVKHFICMDKLEGFETVESLREEGKAALDAGFLDYLNLPIDSESMSIILFTSGTTSMSKAVMLSQKNITSNIYSLLKIEDIRSEDVNMAFLPYHHTFGSTGQLVMLAAGVTTAFCDGLKYLQANMVEYKVSIFFCVPLLIESIYKRIMATVKKQGLESKIQFGLKLTKFLLKFGIDIRRKVFKPVLDQLGGNIRLVISGASAIDPEALNGFIDFGIMAVQGFGMTESAPVLAAENHIERKCGSIGLAIPGVELAIDEPNAEGVGELIAHGPNIMSGYYENPEETAKTLAGGWLHTGDLAYIDNDGYIFICGRKKNVIVLKNGKNVYPEEIELLISNLPYVEENMVYGKPRHDDGDQNDLALCAKIVYKPDYFLDNHGIDTCGGTNADATAQIEAYIKEDIDKINDTLPSYKQLLRLNITDEPMVKTTTGKVKRFEEIKGL